MNEVLLTNVFFVITAAAVIVVSVFVCVLCYHAIRVTKQAREMLDRIETRTEILINDVRVLRDRIANGTMVSRVLGTIVSAMTGTKSRRSSSRKKKVINEE